MHPNLDMRDEIFSKKKKKKRAGGMMGMQFDD